MLFVVWYRAKCVSGQSGLHLIDPGSILSVAGHTLRTTVKLTVNFFSVLTEALRQGDVWGRGNAAVTFLTPALDGAEPTGLFPCGPTGPRRCPPVVSVRNAAEV